MMPCKCFGSCMSRASHAVTTSSSSVADGDVRHNIALTSSAAASISASTEIGAALIAKYAKKRG